MTFVYVVLRDAFILGELDGRFLVLLLRVLNSWANEDAHTAVCLLLQMSNELSFEDAGNDRISLFVAPGIENDPVISKS